MENAFDAVVEPGSTEPWVRVSAAVTPTRLEIAVQDRGAGMSPEVKARAFELLYSTKSFGVGLGLPTVERVLQDHEGGVEVETEEGPGTTFRLWIPLPPALGD